MNTLFFIGAGIVLALIILSKIPGLEHTVKPLIDLLFTGIKFAIENAFSWTIWLFKLLWAAHLDVITHLVLSDEAIDPSMAFKE
ncbi:MAG: hypothetical protein Q7S87_16415 [Agitococcus sp.]|nr:hypothetical protein [Agitococcus sp.]MDO9176963.1 hypothetical protein [Agitococcus sp.]